MSDLTRRGRVALLAAASAMPALAAPARALPSWTESPRRRAILDFVAKVTSPGAGFVPPEQRIATFDNDGTLWCEQPIYTEAAFMADRVRALVEANPELRDQQPYKAVVERDLATLAKQPEAALLKMIDDTHAGMTVEAYEALARQWIDTARHPRFKRLYRELIYPP